MFCCLFFNPLFNNHSGMSASTSSFFIVVGSSFPNIYSTIYGGMIHFVLLSFSSTVPLFEVMDMVLLITKNYFHTVETLTSLIKL